MEYATNRRNLTSIVGNAITKTGRDYEQLKTDLHIAELMRNVNPSKASELRGIAKVKKWILDERLDTLKSVSRKLANGDA